MTIQVNVQEAKTRLSQIMAHAESGEDVVIARDGHPVVRLVPVVAPPRRKLGFVSGRVTDAFFGPLPEEELEQWA